MALEMQLGRIQTNDAYTPKQVAERARKAGIAKANLDFWTMFLLAILAGLFIGLGAELCTLVITGIDVGFGLTKLLGGLVFSLGLVLVVIAGAELFTGNNLLAIAWMSGSIPGKKLLYNWGVVYLGNMIGSLALAGLMYLTGQWAGANYGIGATAITIAASKVNLPFITALSRGILCNFLVCLAVWLCFSARTASGKILAIIFPITAFVASGFEHSVANMYFIPYGLLMKSRPDVVATAGLSLAQIGNLNVWGFLGNLIPVTLGNIIGGGIMVGAIYWFIYLRKEAREVEAVKPYVAQVPMLLPAPEGNEMKTWASEKHVKRLLSFGIASGDMYHSIVNERVIYAFDDPESGFRVWGEIPGTGEASTVDLCRVILEYGMTCKASDDLPGAFRAMENFSKRLGETLAIQIMEATPAETGEHRAACALECVFESMRAHFTLQEHAGEMDFLLKKCPLCENAKDIGIWEVDLAHHGLNVLVQSLIHAINPTLKLKQPVRPQMDHIYSIISDTKHRIGAT